MEQLKWEQIPQDLTGSLNRTPIFGGWLVRLFEDIRSPINIGYPQPDYQQGYEWRPSICFVPDPNHEWDLTVPYNYKSK